MNQAGIELSVILPVLNEAENLEPLHQKLIHTLDQSERTFEIIYCDDGSNDGSTGLIRSFANQNPKIKAVFFRKTFGQTAAITAGIDHAQGKIIILMDADGQNDPTDIPKLLAKLDEGYDIVSGWRKNRRDPWLTKKLPSKIANGLIAKVTGVHLHDTGCTLKAYRKEILDGVSLYGEMHRFIPVYGHWMGARVTEVEVNHLPRTLGQSKYSLTRTFKVILDLPVLVLMGNYLTRPAHFFGAIGLLFSFLSFITGCLVIVDKITDPNAKAHRNPLLLICIFFALAAIQVILIGLLAELMTRVYHESQNKKIYVIRETLNMNDSNES